MNSTYYEALSFCRTSTRENGIDYALTHYTSTKLSALLVPPDVGQTYQIAAQAGRSHSPPQEPPPPPTPIYIHQLTPPLPSIRLPHPHPPRLHQHHNKHALRSRPHVHRMVRSLAREMGQRD